MKRAIHLPKIASGVIPLLGLFGRRQWTRYNAFAVLAVCSIVGLSALGDLAQIDPVALVRQEKTLKGAYYGSSRPAMDFYRMVDLYQSGQIDVDGLVTRTYTLDQINQAYEELDRGVVGRGIIAFQ